MRYELKGKARTRPEFFRVVLGPCSQFYPCEASEKKWGQTPKSKPISITRILQTTPASPRPGTTEISKPSLSPFAFDNYVCWWNFHYFSPSSHCNTITRKAPQLLHGRAAESPCRNKSARKHSFTSITCTDLKLGRRKR